ncbi:MAG: 5-(carboxyamino)imidazole ribonucleotide synthase [Betaproteobacteria bacterium]
MTELRSPLPPGSWLGVLGGGQLGRMFTHAAQALGYRVCSLDLDEDGPAGSVADRHLRADYLDPAALDELGSLCAAVTTEFENVPAAALQRLAARCFVSPAARCVAVAQDRIDEKSFIAGQGIPVAPHKAIRTEADLAAAGANLFPAILKTARMGYDGKGQVAVASAAALPAAWTDLKRVPCVLEKRLPLAKELSVIVCRAADGAAITLPVAENEHRGGILAVSIVPARIDAALAEQARTLALRVAQGLDYVGVLCVEMFVLADGSLAVNEIAPRPHNSGHWSIDAAASSQFEQQARLLAGLPLGDTRVLLPAVMLNLLGDLWFDRGVPREPPWAEVLRERLAKLHLYGKREARPGRKMGHLTLLGNTVEDALAAANRCAARLGIGPVG